ncbi:uncharacterized protein LOC116394717 isoform X2 [Anarrhichthys ocellatus]|uniref:uncharacterized protein LOC116394717 isoform X2 n=1 Tax=Anarrhichthys ocellatus TaxID=433405 RepID=UPI0012EEB602|nr:uncharacterized protein LOC116394717 isoform X2 [Anarrhichthys ocellatus]
MDLQTCLTILITVFCTANSLECPRTNISCKDIITADRFTFLHRCLKGSEIFVFDNRTLVAFAVLGSQTTKHLNETIIGNHSVDTIDCRDLKIKCMVPIGEFGVHEICVYYKVTETLNVDSFHSPRPWSFIISGSVCVVGLIVLIGGLCYMFRKKKQHDASIVSRILPHLCISSKAEMREIEQTRNPEGSEVQASTADHLDTIRLSEISATDPREGGENDIEQDNALKSVHVHSIDPTADGKAPQSSGLDRNSSNQGIQPTERGDVIASDGTRASNRRAVSSLRDDPGGVKDNDEKAIDGIREVRSSRWTVGDRAPEDHGNEGQPLLLNQRAANQCFDMTGKAVALVDKCGFDPDQVSRCSTVPDADVESTPNMKN